MNTFLSISVLKSDKTFVCDTCHRAKQRKLPFPNNDSYASSPFSLIHVDIWGPCATTALNGHKYFLTIVDDHTRFVWIFIMTSKVETQTHLQAFVSYVERQFNTKVKAIRSDNGAEFIMKHFYHNTGIIHQTSCVETAQQNGIVERKQIKHQMTYVFYLGFRYMIFERVY